jgi:rSAM/selenodomain-associated transferase 1
MKKQNTQKALLIFTRNPELGKVKTRLATTIGDTAALKVYQKLLEHTVDITQPLKVDKFVFYSEQIQENDHWDTTIYSKELQKGTDLGERMHHAFESLFKKGYRQIVIVGSDIFELTTKNIQEAFTGLDSANFVVGPALDGGYYLLGMNTLNKSLFEHKKWGTSTVLKATLKNLAYEKVALLATKNDIDTYDDLKKSGEFNQFLMTP